MGATQNEINIGVYCLVLFGFDVSVKKKKKKKKNGATKRTKTKGKKIVCDVVELLIDCLCFDDNHPATHYITHNCFRQNKGNKIKQMENKWKTNGKKMENK